MAYCTQQNVEDRFASTKWWSDLDQDGSINASIVAAHIAFADGTINRYVAQQYAVPLTLSNTAVADMIRDAAVLLAGWKLAARVNDSDARAALRDDYDEIIDWLKMVAKGDITLPGETDADEQPAIGPIVTGDSVQVTRETTDGL